MEQAMLNTEKEQTEERNLNKRLPDDNAVIDLFFARDEEAISCCSRKYGHSLRKISRNVVTDEELVKECENDTYMQAWNLIPPNEPRTYLFAFLARIIRSISLDVCRKNAAKKRMAVIRELSTELEECIPDRSKGNDAERILGNKELGAVLSSWLRELPAEQRMMFVRRYWYMDSVRDIAKHIRASEGKVKSSLFRMRNKLREYLEKEGYEI